MLGIISKVIEYNIVDFSNWKDDSTLEATFNKLINGLELFYKTSRRVSHMGRTSSRSLIL